MRNARSSKASRGSRANAPSASGYQHRIRIQDPFRPTSRGAQSSVTALLRRTADHIRNIVRCETGPARFGHVGLQHYQEWALAVEDRWQAESLSQIEYGDVVTVPLKRNDRPNAPRIYDKIPACDAKRQILHAFLIGSPFPSVSARHPPRYIRRLLRLRTSPAPDYDPGSVRSSPRSSRR
jgi:hypothetical protein